MSSPSHVEQTIEVSKTTEIIIESKVETSSKIERKINIEEVEVNIESNNIELAGKRDRKVKDIEQ